MIGGGDFATDRLIPDAIRAWSSGARLEVRNPTATRPWQHVLEPLRGYLLYVEALHRGVWVPEALNFGPGDGEVPVQLLVKLLAAHLEGLRWVKSDRREPAEAHELQVSSELAHEFLGWSPWLNVESAAAMTADWYRAWHGGENLKGVTSSQIDRYLGASA